MSQASVDIEGLILEKHRAVQLAQEWMRVACALAFATGEKQTDGRIVYRIPKALINQLDHSVEAKPVKGGGLVLTLTPTKEG